MEDTLDLPVVTDQHAFNLERWEEVCADPVLAAVEGRVETDRYGKLVMTPPPGFDHGDRQFGIGKVLDRLLRAGKVLTECPVSTSDGVKGVDVVWISRDRIAEARRGNILVKAPEICVEVISPSNTRREIDEKKALYFEAGADEVWICDRHGKMFFYAPDTSLNESVICPEFPMQITD